MILFEILLVVCGALAASALIVRKQPNAAEALAKLAPYQGILGAIVGIWSIWAIIDGIRGFSALSEASAQLNALLALAPDAAANAPGLGKIKFMLLVYILSGVVGLLLGFLLAYGLLNTHVLSKNPEAAARGLALQTRLTGIQIPLGLAGIVLGILGLISRAMV